MTRDEKIEVIASVLEIDQHEVEEDKLLADYETWDSVAVLALISVISENFGRFPKASEIMELKTVKDILNALE